MTETEQNELREKIVKGIALAYERPAEQKKREDGELVFEKGGKLWRSKLATCPKRRKQIANNILPNSYDTTR
jgi:hypothetical protein